MVCSPEGETKYSDIVARVLQVDTVAHNLFTIYILRTSIDLIKENFLHNYNRRL